MKTRESGMPDESTWTNFFNPPRALELLGLSDRTTLVVEFGCGHGTFTIPAAQRSEAIIAFDIEPGMVAETTGKAKALGLQSVRAEVRDFVEQGTGLPDATADYAMLFNILHAVESPKMLGEARRVLRPGGLLGVMHWNYDPATPRGPSMDIRPRPDQIFSLAVQSGFEQASNLIDLPPYHYGFIFRKVDATSDS